MLFLVACGSLDEFFGLENIVPDDDQLLDDAAQGKPGEPWFTQYVMDCSIGNLVTPGELIQPPVGCDNWETNRFERPFNAIGQDEYYPDLDILHAEFGLSGGWFYLRIGVYDPPRPGSDYLEGTYGVEIDTDEDGRGDYLILVVGPGQEGGSEWNVQGVQIWFDANNDVGNVQPEEPDGPYEGDGYEELIFDQGEGEDPGAAWARVFMTGSAFVELAFKEAVLGGAETFQWWVWADQGVEDPSFFDYHDSIPHADAGDAYEGLAYFPVNQVFAVDNTCASLWGAPPNDDPDLCENDPHVPKDRPPERTPPPTSTKPVFTFTVTPPGYTPPGLLTPTQPETPTKPGTRTSTWVPTITATATSTGTSTSTATRPGNGRGTPTCNYNCLCDVGAGEDPNSCPYDCPQPYCGDGVCKCGENWNTCSLDCPPSCNNNCKCNPAAGENQNTCPNDCPTPNCRAITDKFACDAQPCCEYDYTNGQCKNK